MVATIDTIPVEILGKILMMTATDFMKFNLPEACFVNHRALKAFINEARAFILGHGLCKMIFLEKGQEQIRSMITTGPKKRKNIKALFEIGHLFKLVDVLTRSNPNMYQKVICDPTSVHYTIFNEQVQYIKMNPWVKINCRFLNIPTRKKVFIQTKNREDVFSTQYKLLLLLVKHAVPLPLENQASVKELVTMLHCHQKLMVDKNWSPRLVSEYFEFYNFNQNYRKVMFFTMDATLLDSRTTLMNFISTYFSLWTHHELPVYINIFIELIKMLAKHERAITTSGLMDWMCERLNIRDLFFVLRYSPEIELNFRRSVALRLFVFSMIRRALNLQGIDATQYLVDLYKRKRWLAVV